MLPEDLKAPKPGGLVELDSVFVNLTPHVTVRTDKPRNPAVHMC
jgi:hypothetical protein